MPTGALFDSLAMDDLRMQRSETEHSDSDVNVNTGNDKSVENDAEDESGENNAEDGVVNDLDIYYFDQSRDQVTEVEAATVPNGGDGRAGQYERDQTQQQDVNPVIEALPLEGKRSRVKVNPYWHQ